MSIWMLLTFAAAMAAIVLGYAAPAVLGNLAIPAFVVLTTVFLLGVLRKGIREPVV